MTFKPTNDLTRLAKDLHPNLRSLLAGRLTDHAKADLSEPLIAIFGTANPFQIIRIIEFCGALIEIERKLREVRDDDET